MKSTYQRYSEAVALWRQEAATCACAQAAYDAATKRRMAAHNEKERLWAQLQQEIEGAIGALGPVGSSGV